MNDKKQPLSQKVNEIFDYLNECFPNPVCELNFTNNFELLCAVILSAQCTDKRVNLVTPNLFKLYPTPQLLSNAPLNQIENIIKSCGFYHNKAKALKNMSAELCERFKGIVPNNFDDLISLSGVGRKTANVVLAVGFKQNQLGVDTHIFRIAHRLNLSNGTTPEKVEKDLRKVLKGRRLDVDHYLLVLFGRYKCKAIKPDCVNCKLNHLCTFKSKKTL